ncbi:Chondroitin polymerase [Anaerotruncus sp. 2789STDY5834896]|uniref:Chondroitin polymerase n=1 Tax=uncultured Anaerotruncus sp. TaxID=905011 RepID=A0A1C6JDM0_9FIRM|nr:Chondroitin polymerase [uncultured Anaerotruncus sp.]
MSKPSISIIIPVFNASCYLSRCIKSIRGQSFVAWELIVVDDGSTDDSADIYHRFASLDNRIHIFRQKNAGPSSARNTGIRHAKGDYVVFVDADDWLEPNMLATLHALIKTSDLALCGYYRDFFKPHKNIFKEISVTIPSTTLHLYDIDNTVFNELYKKSYLNALWNKLYRNDFIKKNSLCFREDIQIGEDLLFNLAYLSNINTIRISSEPLYHYVEENSRSLTRKFTPERIRYNELVYQSICTFKTDVLSLTHPNTVDSDIYLRGCFTILEQIFSSKDLRETEKNIYVQKILNSAFTSQAINATGCRSLEFVLYRVLLKIKVPFLLKAFTHFRLFVKKMLR